MTPPARSRFVTVDLETRSCCELRDHGGHLYAEHRTTRLLCVPWHADGEYHIWLPGVEGDVPEGLVKQHLQGVVIHTGRQFPPIPTDRPWVGHNSFGFDEIVWAKLAPAELQPPRWIDSMCLAAAAGLPQGLGQIGQRLWGEGKYGEGSSELKKGMRATSINDCDPENVPIGRTVLIARYAIQDVRLTVDLMEELEGCLHLPPSEWQVIDAHRAINNRGVRIDAGLVTCLYRLADEAVEDAVKQIAELTDGFFPDAESLRKRTRVLAWVKSMGQDFGESLRREVVNQFIEGAQGQLEATDDSDSEDDGDPIGSTANLLLVVQVLQLRQAAMRITGSKLEAAGNRVDAEGIARALFAYWGAGCVSGDTELLTEKGWVRIDGWWGGRIAQWSPDGDIRFASAAPNRFVTEEPTVVLEGPYASGRFTAGHTVPTYNTVKDFKVKQAGDMLGTAQASLPVSGVLTTEGSITACQMRVLVAVQADGHWETDTKKGRGLQLGLVKKRKVMRIQELLNAAGVPFRVQSFPSRPTYIRVSVRWADCPDWLTPERKFFGPWLLNSTRKARQAFVEELKHWDGHDSGPKANVEYYSAVRSNLEWASTMCHMTGKAAKVVVSNKISIRETDRTQCWSSHWREAPPMDVVYCPTTETGYWVYRHNGIIGITGNTGRWAGRGIQVQNLPRPKEGVPIWPLLRYYKQHGELPLAVVKRFLQADARRKNLKRPATADDAASGLIRSLFVPHEGDECLLSADLAAIEVRVLAWLAGEQWLLEEFRQGGDPYIAFCKRVTGETIKKKDPRRQVFKVLELGGGFQCGGDKMAVYAAGQGVDLASYGLTPQAAVDSYRDAHPAIAGSHAGTFDDGRKWRSGGLWNDLNAAAIAVVRGEAKEVLVGRCLFYRERGHLYVRLPSGRELVYRSAGIRMQTKWGKDRPSVIYASARFRTTGLYGGKICENLVQATASDFIRESLVRCERLGLQTVLHVHDELVVSGRREQLPQFLHAMTEVPDWADGFPLEAEGGWLPRYAKGPPKGETWKEQVWRNGKRVK